MNNQSTSDTMSRITADPHNHGMPGMKLIRTLVFAPFLVSAVIGSACSSLFRSQATDFQHSLHEGIATSYNATGAGACLFGPSPADLMVAAMNAEEYNNSAVCGAYVHITGPKGAVTVRIVDLCPECQAGHLDLSREAFSRIADPVQGRVPITWQVVSPELTGPIAYHFKEGSNQWWTAVQIRNHRNPVARLEYLDVNGQWKNVPRTAYNYFVQTKPGMGQGPYTFRVTDSYGNALIDNAVPHIKNGTVNGANQFPSAP